MDPLEVNYVMALTSAALITNTDHLQAADARGGLLARCVRLGTSEGETGDGETC